MIPTIDELLQAGLRLLGAGRHEDAARVAQQLLSGFPGDRRAHLFAADTADARGDWRAALAHLDALPPQQRESAPVLLRRAQLLFARSRRAEALAAALAAAACLEPDEWQYRTLARILVDCQQVESARDWLLRGRAALPGRAALLFDLALAEFHLDHTDEAEQHLAELLRAEAFHAGALHLRSALRTQTVQENHLADLEQRLAGGPRQPRFIAACCYALAKEYEDLQQYDQSSAALGKGARAYRSSLQYDLGEELAAHRTIRDSFTAEAFRSLAPGFDAESPIFVIGMPRTGTTLVERLLGNHSRVRSIGEFTDFPLLLAELVQQQHALVPPPPPGIDLSLRIDFRELGKRYVEAARQLAGSSPSFVDKLPFNFLYCGYILAALPNARLIHLERDPLDTCYAVYKTMFARSYHFSYDLDELAGYYIGYRQHMRHWHEVLPGRILDVRYEDLVRDPQVQARRILDWCDLPWEDAVLAHQRDPRPSMTASAVQVRQPLHSDSIGSWRRAGSAFDRVRERLAGAGLIASADD